MSEGITADQLDSDVITVKKASRTLTNAQILALPTTPVEIVPAPGAGKQLVFMRGILVFHKTGEMNNITPTDGTSSAQSISFSYAASDNQQASVFARAAELFSVDGRRLLLAPAVTQLDATKTDVWAHPAASESDIGNQPIVLLAYNADGNYEDGDAANTLVVTVWYGIYE